MLEILESGYIEPKAPVPWRTPPQSPPGSLGTTSVSRAPSAGPLNGREHGGTAVRVPARVTAMATDDEMISTLREARQGILWKIVENLNSGPTDVDKLRGLAAAYNLLSQSGTRPFES